MMTSLLAVWTNDKLGKCDIQYRAPSMLPLGRAEPDWPTDGLMTDEDVVATDRTAASSVVLSSLVVRATL